MPASSLHSYLYLGTMAKHPPPHPLAAPGTETPASLQAPGPSGAGGHFPQARRGDAGKSQTTKGRCSLRVCQRCPEHRKARRPPPTAGHSLEKKRRRLKAHPHSLGITKAENYKTKYKGENQHVSVEPSAPRRRSRRCPRRAGAGGTFCFLPAAPAPRPALPRCCIGRSQAAPHTL